MNLVVGATGMLGSEICRLLATGGKPVRALARRSSAPGKIAALRALGNEIVFGGKTSDVQHTCRKMRCARFRVSG